jgi:signal transduction histidine kinase
MKNQHNFYSFLKIYYNKFSFALVPVLFLSGTFLYGQKGKEFGAPLLTNFRNGLEFTAYQNWCAIQDKRGIMYFGTDAGIVEFDGIDHKLIEVPSVIRSFCFAQDSVIYATGDYDFGYLSYSPSGATKFVSLAKAFEKQKKISNTRFVKVYSTEEGVYFLSDSLILRYNHNQFKIFPVDLELRLGNCVNKQLFLFTKDKGIALFHKDTVHYLPHTKEIFANSGKVEILPYGQNKFLVVTKNKGLYIYHYDSLLHHPLYPDVPEKDISSAILEKFTTEVEDYLIQNIVYPSVMLDKDTYAFGTIMGGILIMNAKGELVRVINENRGLYDNIIYNLYADQQKNLWAIMKNGVSYIELSNPLSFYNEKNGLSKHLIHAKVLDNELYISHEKGLSYLSDYHLSISDDKQRFKEIGLIKGRVDDIFIHDHMLICDADEKLYAIYRKKAKMLSKIEVVYNFVKSSKLKNHFFYSSDRKGLGYFKISNKNLPPGKAGPFPAIALTEIKEFTNLPPSIQAIEDPAGNILLFTRHEGTFHIKFQNYSVNKYTVTRYDSIGNLPAELYQHAFIFDNHLFAGLANKLVEATFVSTSSWDSITGFVPETYFGGVFADSSIVIYNGKALDTNRCWLYTSQGLKIILRQRKGKFSILTIPLYNKHISDVFIASDGIIWITSSNTLYSYDPAVSKYYPKHFHTLLRKVSIGQDSVIFDGAFYDLSAGKNKGCVQMHLHQPSYLTQEIDFENNSIKFEYAALFFESIDQNKYSYFLDGFENKWSNWSIRSKKEYSYLPPGEYCFKVRAKNVYGMESTISSYFFTIHPPWYQTTVAYVCYLILLAFFFVLGVKLYFYRLIRSQKRLENIIENRTREITTKNQELSKKLNEIRELENFKESMINMIVHDLKSPLNNIIGYSGEKNHPNTSIVLNSSRTMMNMIDNILNVHKFEKSKIKLNAEIHNIRQVVWVAVQEVAFSANEKNLDIINNVYSENFMFDADLIKRVLINLLSNAIKFSPTGEKITADSQIIRKGTGTYFKLQITDKGKGIPEDMKGRIFDKYVQVEARKLGIANSTGLGLTFCKMVIEAHRGKIEVDSEVGKGSIFSFILPLIN